VSRSRNSVARPKRSNATKRALQLNPDEAEAHNNLGFTLASNGRIVEPFRSFERRWRSIARRVMRRGIRAGEEESEP